MVTPLEQKQKEAVDSVRKATNFILVSWNSEGAQQLIKACSSDDAFEASIAIKNAAKRRNYNGESKASE